MYPINVKYKIVVDLFNLFYAATSVSMSNSLKLNLSNVTANYLYFSFFLYGYI